MFWALMKASVAATTEQLKGLIATEGEALQMCVQYTLADSNMHTQFF